MSLPSGLAICTKPTNHYLTEEKVKKSFNVLRVNVVLVVAQLYDKTAKGPPSSCHSPRHKGPEAQVASGQILSEGREDNGFHLLGEPRHSRKQIKTT